ncbi:MAG: hypothetical protein ACJARS_003718 [bacterium]|jgi:hypothetical protein
MGLTDPNDRAVSVCGARQLFCQHHASQAVATQRERLGVYRKLAYDA